MTGSAHAFQDPMVETRRRGADLTHSGVFCDGCHKERPRLDAQWGGKLCARCRKANAQAQVVHFERRTGRTVAPGSRSLGDINDIVAYCERVVDRRFPYIDDPEEYVNEAVAISYRLHAEKWRADLQPSFSKYLSTLLWQRLKDYWRSDIRQQGRGRRKQEGGFEATPVESLDALRDARIEIGYDEGGL